MKVGDLVKCLSCIKTLDGSVATGIAVEHFKVSDLWGVILSHTGAMACFCNTLRLSMRVGDLVVTGVRAYVGVAIRVNSRGGGLVRSMDGSLEYWVNSWSGEVISASR